MVSISFSDQESRNQLGLGIKRNERPDIPATSLKRRNLSLLFADETPNFVDFDLAAIQIAEPFMLNLGATLPDADSKPHDRIALNVQCALNRPDAAALCQHCDCHDSLFGWKIVCHAQRLPKPRF